MNILAYAYLAANIATYVFSTLYIKKSSKTMDVLSIVFWFSFISTSIFTIQELVRHIASETFDAFIENYLILDLPLDLFIVTLLAASYIIWAYILQNYNLGKASIYFQLRAVFTSILYILLGAPINVATIVAMSFVVVGTIIAAYKKNAPSKNNFGLAIWGTTLSFIGALIAAIIFILTQKTGTTEYLVSTLDHIHHTSAQHFLSSENLKFSTKFLSMVLIFAYISYQSKVAILLKTLRDNLNVVLICSIAKLINTMSFYKAYNLFENKVEFLSLLKLELPIVLFFSYLILYEEISIKKVIGATIIVTANLALLFA